MIIPKRPRRVRFKSHPRHRHVAVFGPFRYGRARQCRLWRRPVPCRWRSANPLGSLFAKILDVSRFHHQRPITPFVGIISLVHHSAAVRDIARFVDPGSAKSSGFSSSLPSCWLKYAHFQRTNHRIWAIGVLSIRHSTCLISNSFALVSPLLNTNAFHTLHAHGDKFSGVSLRIGDSTVPGPSYPFHQRHQVPETGSTWLGD